MKNVLLALVIAISLVGLSSAQNNMSLGAGLVVSLPMGDFGDAANLGIGGTAAFEMGFTPQLVGVANVGYISWSTDLDGYSWTAVPVMLGVKYYLTPGAGFYGLGQVGLTFFTLETPAIVVPFFGTIGGGSVSESEFTLAIGAGYELPLSSNVMLDLTGAFNLISDLNHITLRAGVKFDL
jgi:opacity protein-like surface antigen